MTKTVVKSEGALRINRYLARYAGLSRRRADHLISQGQVTVNGSKIVIPGAVIDGKKDRVTLRNKPVRADSFRPVYYMFYKPENVLTAKNDPTNRPVVMDYFKKIRCNVFPVGRLDWNSEGLLLLTNDGDFAHRILHPKHKISKTYFVKIKGRLKAGQIQKLLRGVSLPSGRARALYVKQRNSTASTTWVKVIISEGRNRQIRRMFLQINCSVLKLKRTAVGRLNLSRLRKGVFRSLSEKEAQKVFIRAKELS